MGSEDPGSKEIEKIEDPEVIDEDQAKGQKGRILHMQRSEFHSGPLPPPKVLEEYGKVVNGGAERIVRVFEKQVQHRINQEKLLLRADIRRSDRGLIFGFVLALAITVGGFALIISGFEILGIAAVLTPLASIVGVFVYTQQTREKEKAQAPKPVKKLSKPKVRKKPTKKTASKHKQNKKSPA